MYRQIASAVGVVLLLCAASHAATVTYDLVLADNPSQRQVTVAPGADVPVILTVRLDPTNGDSDGLGFVVVGIDTSFSDPQEAMTLDPDFASHFPAFASGGSAQLYQGRYIITQVGGSQPLGGPYVRNLGVGTAITIATGVLRAAATPGTYTVVAYNDGTTRVLKTGQDAMMDGSAVFAPALSIQVQSSSGGGGTAPIPPTAAFSFAPDAGDPATILFDASSSTGDGLNYSWNFGDGQSGTGVTTSHKYGNGNWTAVLTVTDSHNATASKSAAIAVSIGGGTTPTPPTAAFSFVPDTSNPATINFDASASTGEGLSYSWAFGDGQNGTGVTSPHTYANGNWTAVLTVTDSHGATATSSAQIAVSVGGGTNPPPDGGNNPPSDGGDNSTPAPVIAPMCGAGVAQMALFSMVGLFALQLTRRRY
jgi:chitodextrinase